MCVGLIPSEGEGDPPYQRADLLRAGLRDAQPLPARQDKKEGELPVNNYHYLYIFIQ